MAEYIDREALYEKAYWHGEHPDVGNPFPDGVDAIDIKDVDAIPAADVSPVVHGLWIEKMAPYGGRYFECSNCGAHENIHTAIKGYYCWKCGARMDGDDDAKAD
ncbi:MAG: hypothetical protein SO081_03505 [Oscillospiraceae bacterium]|nr:hypothetical protein [Oscillospiraceae bacterium]